MAASLVTKNGAPFNLVKEGGRWYFATDLFPQEYGLMARELRLVPQELIPSGFNKGGNTAYIPESTILSYFKSNQFKNIYNVWSANRPGALAGAAQQLQTPMSTDTITINASNIANAVANNISKLDEKTRTVQSQAAVAAASTPAQNKKTTLPAGWMGALAANDAVASASAVSMAISKTADGSYKYGYLDGAIVDKNKTPFVFFPDSSGKIIALSESEYQSQLGRMSVNQIKAWQKALGSNIVDGVLKPEETQAIIAQTRLASNTNFSNLQSGAKSFKPVSPLEYAKQYTAAINAANAAASGVGKTATDTRTQATEFTSAWVGEVAKQFFDEYLGQAPTQQQINRLTTLLNSKAKAAPGTSTTKTTKLDTLGSTRSTTSTKAGFDQTAGQALIEQQAKSQVGVTGYQASTKYMDVIMSMIRNPVG